MSDLKITIEQLRNYLGTGLKCECIHKTVERVELKNKVFTLNGIIDHDKRWPYFTSDREFVLQFGCVGKYFKAKDFKPICYRLSDIDKEIEVNGEKVIPVEKLFPIDTKFEQDLGIKSMDHFESMLNYGVEGFNYSLLICLFNLHFWPFGEEYFEQGLVIDKMKI